MKIKAKKQFQLPTDGWHLAVIADAVDVGIKETKFGLRPKLRTVSFLDEKDTTGRAIELWSYYTCSVFQTSKFAELVRITTGDNPKLDTNGDFDTDGLRGRQYWIKTERRITAKGTFANITALKPSQSSDQRLAIPLDYTSTKDQHQQVTNRSNGGFGSPEADRGVEFPGD